MSPRTYRPGDPEYFHATPPDSDWGLFKSMTPGQVADAMAAETDSDARDPREPTCACGLSVSGAVVIHEAARCGPGTGLSADLAQRILAALERDIWTELAAELRAVIGK